VSCEDGSEELVRIRLLYGVSWMTRNSYDHDGSLTRWCCHVEAGDRRLGIGVGHQDLSVDQRQSGHALVGMGSVSEISLALTVDDPRFREKCAVRGLDPDEVLRSPWK
jgi:hypothetical protein